MLPQEFGFGSWLASVILPDSACASAGVQSVGCHGYSNSSLFAFDSYKEAGSCFLSRTGLFLHDKRRQDVVPVADPSNSLRVQRW